MKTGLPYVVLTMMMYSLLIPVISAVGIAPVGVRPGSAENATPPAINQIDPPATDGSFAPNLHASGDRAILSWLEPSVHVKPAHPTTYPGAGSDADHRRTQQEDGLAGRQGTQSA